MRNRNISVGLFVTGGLLLFALGMFLIGDRRQAFGQHAEYFSEFGNLAGLSNGAKVRVGGMDAGTVLAIGVPDSPPSRFRVRWRIDTKLRGLVRTDSVATIDTEGVVGGTFLSIRTGTGQAPQARALATIPSREPIELSELLARGTGLLNDTQALLKSVGGKIDGALDGVTTTVSNVNDIALGLKQGKGAAGMLLRDDALAKQLRQTVTTTASNADEIVAGLKAGRGAAGMLLRDDALAGQIRETLKNAQQATVALGHASSQADALISDLNAQKLPQKVNVVMDRVGDATLQVHQLVSEINKPDQQGVSAGANIRESLANASAATVNLADSTEALKHNFLLRGFFRRRGYYNLDRISPEQYRRDRTFASPANGRAWLSGSELFESGAGGREQLSASGKALVNDALTQYGEAVIESPIVIEGYWQSGRPADQILASRNRAILVRQFLQTQFQLDPATIGIVPMKNLPPDGTGRKSWDGICIVVLKKQGK